MALNGWLAGSTPLGAVTDHVVVNDRLLPTLLLVGEETAVAVRPSGTAIEVRTDVAGTLPSLVKVVVSSAGSTGETAEGPPG